MTDFLGADNFFIYYKPRDIVSGDFFWIHQTSESTLLALADCTGHGVPGSLMSMIGIRMLDEIVTKNKTLNPAKILDELNQAVVKALRSETSQTNEGMDIVILNIHPDKIEFAGAINPLYYFKENGNGVIPELNIIRGDKKTIGGIQSWQTEFFNLKIINRIPGEKLHLYLSSDGYKDQFGGDNNRKLMSQTFKEYLKEAVNLPMVKQCDFFERHFETWKGDTPQTDDVSVLGITLS